MSNPRFIKLIAGIFVLMASSLLAGFVLGGQYKAYEISENVKKAFNSPNEEIVQSFDKTTDDSVMAEIAKENGKITDKNIGDVIELATLRVQTKASEEGTMTNSGTPVVAKQGTKFVFVTLNVTNITKLSLNFPFGFPIIVDEQERVYEPYMGSIGGMENYLDYRDLAPSIPEEGVLTYQLPSDAEHYYLLMAKGGTDDYYRVKLK